MQPPFPNSNFLQLFSSSPPSGRVCPVCGGPSNGFFFGVPSCRACASFFRRSALERRQYVCRRTNNCTISAEGMRNSCRACRLRRCMDAGMNAAKSENSSADVRSQLEHKQQENPNRQINISMTVDLRFPVANQFLKAFRNFENGQLALVNLLDDGPQHHRRGEVPFGTEPKLRLITREEHLRMDRGSISLKCTLIREHFPGFEALKTDEKVHVLQTFTMETCFLHVSDMTLHCFPHQSGLSQLVLFSHCCVIDTNRLDHFFSNVDESEKHINFVKPILDKWFNFILCRFKPLGISALEMAAMMGIQLWNCVERYTQLSQEQCAQRNSLFVELHSMVAQRCGANAAAIATRFGLLLALLQEVAENSREMEESFTMAKIFFAPVGPEQYCASIVAELIEEAGQKHS